MRADVGVRCLPECRGLGLLYGNRIPGAALGRDRVDAVTNWTASRDSRITRTCKGDKLQGTKAELALPPLPSES
jgi:hypothetical protein